MDIRCNDAFFGVLGFSSSGNNQGGEEKGEDGGRCMYYIVYSIDSEYLSGQ